MAQARSHWVTVAVVALVLAMLAALAAEARECSTCQFGTCNATLGTVCSSCYPFYTGVNCDTCKTGTITVSRNGTDLGLGVSFDGTVADCMTKCAAQTKVYAGITNTTSASCTCGNSYGNYGLSPSANDCAPCPSNATLRCGGFKSVSVYFIATGEYRGCYSDPGSATMCQDDLSTPAPSFSTDFTTASKALTGAFIAVCVIGGIYFIGLFFYCVKRRSQPKKKSNIASSSTAAADYLF